MLVLPPEYVHEACHLRTVSTAPRQAQQLCWKLEHIISVLQAKDALHALTTFHEHMPRSHDSDLS